MVMKRYPHGASGEFFFMKRAPSPRPPWIQICSIDHGSSSVIDFPMIQDRAVAAVGDQSRLHRSQPVVRPLRRRRSSRLPALRSRSRRGASFAQVRETALVVHEALETLKMPSFVKTTGSKGMHVYVPIVRGPDAEGGLDVREGAGAGAGVPPSGAPDRRVPRRQTSARPRARRLQPERLGPNARVDLLGSPTPRRDRLDAGDVEGSRARRPHRGLHGEERAGQGRRRSAISGSRCSPRADGST